MTEISLIVTLSNQFTSPHLTISSRPYMGKILNKILQKAQIRHRNRFNEKCLFVHSELCFHLSYHFMYNADLHCPECLCIPIVNRRNTIRESNSDDIFTKSNQFPKSFHRGLLKFGLCFLIYVYFRTQRTCEIIPVHT